MSLQKPLDKMQMMSRGVDLDTDIGRQARENDIDALFRLLSRGVTYKYLHNDVLSDLAVGSSVTSEPAVVGGGIMVMPEHLGGQVHIGGVTG